MFCILYVFSISDHVMVVQRSTSEFPDLGKQNIQAKIVFCQISFFFFGVRYWNVGRNHTHTKKSESCHGTQAMYNYIKIKYYSFFLTFFFLCWNVTKNKPNFLLTAWWYNTWIYNNAFINSYLFLSIYLYFPLMCGIFLNENRSSWWNW